jgi:hypothetical protein
MGKNAPEQTLSNEKQNDTLNFYTNIFPKDNFSLSQLKLLLKNKKKICY